MKQRAHEINLERERSQSLAYNIYSGYSGLFRVIQGLFRVYSGYSGYSGLFRDYSGFIQVYSGFIQGLFRFIRMYLAEEALAELLLSVNSSSAANTGKQNIGRMLRVSREYLSELFISCKHLGNTGLLG